MLSHDQSNSPNSAYSSFNNYLSMRRINCARLPAAGVGAPPAAHPVRALHPLGVPVLRQRLLHDDRPLRLQHSVPTHERERKVRLKVKKSGERKRDYTTDLVM